MYGIQDYRLSGVFVAKLAYGTIFAVTVALCIVGEAVSLRLVNMTLPAVAEPGDNMTLDCHFEMGAEELYSVKWYKDEHEFFRYMPSTQPHVLTFPVPGVEMVPQATSCGQTRCKVSLARLSRHNSGGAYRCEVSSEAPAFRLASATHNVTIAVLPEDDPDIIGLQEGYRIGDLLFAECKSDLSDPVPLLTWYINDVQAPEEVLGNSISSHPDSSGLQYSSQSIRFRVDRKYTQGNLIRLRCVAVVPGVPSLPQSVHRIVRVTTTKAASTSSSATRVNNEKLHWPSAADKPMSRINSIILIVTAVITSCLLF